MNTLTTTIDIGDFEVEVAIDYEAVPGEPMVWRDKHGHGHPGYPPYAELIAVTVTSDVPEEIAKIARETVENDWKRFGDMCLEDANNRAEAAEDAYWDDKFERRRNGD